jgi:hypothetical protein
MLLTEKITTAINKNINKSEKILRIGASSKADVNGFSKIQSKTYINLRYTYLLPTIA